MVIHLNVVTGEVEFRGPITEDEDDYVRTFALKVTTEVRITNAEDDLADTPNSKTKKMRLESLRSTLAKTEAELENHPGRGRFEGIELPSLT